jgi:tRNA pseudouridine32 synthase/23S rRNA pseudouridine746 synthase
MRILGVRVYITPPLKPAAYALHRSSIPMLTTSPETFNLDITNPEASIPDLLSELTGLSRTRIKHAMTCGAVWRKTGETQQRVRRANVRVKAGDKIVFNHSPEALDSVSLTPELIFDGTDFSVWFKPAGMTVSGSRFGDHTALNRWIEMNHRQGNSVFLVHRLDRFTAGLIVVAHRKNTAADLSKQFSYREVEKRYHAIVHGQLKKGRTIDLPLDEKAAISRVSALQQNPGYSLVSVEIATGRKHQIRRHLAAIKHPVVGDRQYGSDDTERDLQLAATSIRFRVPGSKYKSETLHFELDKSRWPDLSNLT